MSLLRRHGRVVRAIAFVACLAVAAYGLAAPPAQPAHAAVAKGAGVLAPADTPVTLSYPGGDLVTSVDDDGVDPAAMSQYISTNLPQAVGLNPGASLSDLLQATYNKLKDVASAPSIEPPPTFSGGSLSVSGSTVTADIPAASVQAVQAAAASEPPNGIITGPGGKCLHVGSSSDGAPVDLQDCDGTQSQHFWLMPDGTIQIFEKCMTANGTGNTTPVVLSACNGGNRQQWKRSGNLGGTLTNPASGRCLDDPGGNTASGTQLEIYDCNGSGNQKFTWPGTPLVAGWVARLIAAVVAGISGIIAYAACLAFFTVSSAGAYTPLALGFCAFWWTFTWTLLFGLITDVLIAVPLNADTWKNLLTGALVAGAVAALGGYFGIALFTNLPMWLRNLGIKALGGLKQLANWLGGLASNGFTYIVNTISGFFSRTVQDAPIELPSVLASAGLSTPGASGEIQSGIAGKCADAYGVASPVPAGTIVALNDCNGNHNQNWTVWSNDSLTVDGRCLNVTGGRTDQGALVQMSDCDGNPGEEWLQVGGALRNPNSGFCLDDPGGTTTNGTQLRIWTCNGTPAQQWALPGGGSVVNGLPCDVYASGGTPCVAAYSTVRAMYQNYSGPLYQVRRSSDGATRDIGLLSTGGDVNAGQQDSFCSGTACTITEIYDQSPEGNNLTIEGPGGAGGQDRGADASALPIAIGGNKAYGVDIEPGVGYRNNSTRAIAVNGQPEGMYMVASGTHVNSACCFDFGNVEANSNDNGASHMDAVNLTTWCGSNSQPCSGSGPWVEADLENGQWMGNGHNPNNLGNTTPFVTAVLKNDGQTTFALKGGDSTSGGLSTWYNGPLPPGYSPMHQEGGIVLGTGGDNSNNGIGSFFEGVMTAGYPSNAAEDAVQANIVAAGYAGSTNPSGGGTGESGGGGGATGESGSGGAPSAAGQAVVHSAGATGLGAFGFSSVYTVDAGNGHLQETYLPYMFDSWTTQDLSANYGTPAVAAGTQPVSVVHCGWTSVYTVDAGSHHLQETYLPAIGGPWHTQDLSANYGTPPTTTTPTAVMHNAGAPGSTDNCGWTSVYTVDSNGDLQETYLPNAGFPGDPWTTQDLSANYGTPTVLSETAPVAVVHCGWTSLYTVDASSHHLQETYLPAIGDAWSTQDLSANYGTPPTSTTPTAVVHNAGAPGASAGCGWTSVYTVDQGTQHLQETYLPNAGFPGDAWSTQDLSANYGTPPVVAGTQPVALVHMGWTSLYTVDQNTRQLQETYLPAIGDAWSTQSLSANYNTPTTNQSPIVLLHPDPDGIFDWTSVFTIDDGSGDLQETYLPNTGFPGDPWNTQNLSVNYGTPPST